MKYSLKELSDAIVQNKSIIIKYYLAKKSDPNAADYNGFSLLHQAANFKRLEIAKILIEAGAMVNAKMDGYKQPLNMALELPKNISKFGMIINGSFRMYSKKYNIPQDEDNQFKLVKLLLDSGADVNQHKTEGQITHYELYGFRTPLTQAASNGNTRITDLLIEYGADINASDYNFSTALNEAVINGRTDVVELLINKGANVNTQQSLGDTPLIRSIYSVSNTIMDINSSLKKQNKSLTNEETQAIQDDYKKITNLLLKAGAKVNQGCERERPPIFACINERRDDLLKIIIEAGADTEHTNTDGEKPIHFIITVAKRVDYFEKELYNLLITLIASGANKEAKNSQGKTAFELAKENNFNLLMEQFI